MGEGRERRGGGMKISDFQMKDVINIVDGKKLGQVGDLELDLRHGRIEAIVIPAPGRFFGLVGGGSDVVIPWQNIVKIGEDVVLVRLGDAAGSGRGLNGAGGDAR